MQVHFVVAPIGFPLQRVQKHVPGAHQGSAYILGAILVNRTTKIYLDPSWYAALIKPRQTDKPVGDNPDVTPMGHLPFCWCNPSSGLIQLVAG